MEKKNEYTLRKAWIKAATDLCADPKLTVACPACGHSSLSLRYLPAGQDKIERHVFCTACGLESYLYGFVQPHEPKLFHPDDPPTLAERAASYIVGQAAETETPPIFHEHDVVALRREVPGLPWPAGTSGTVHLMRQGNPPRYLVEFPQTSKGDDGLHDVSEADLILIQAVDNPRPWD